MAIVLVSLAIAVTFPILAFIGYGAWNIRSARRACQWALVNAPTGTPVAGGGAVPVSIMTPAFGPLGPCQAWVVRADPTDPVVVIQTGTYVRDGWYGFVYHKRPLGPPLLIRGANRDSVGIMLGGFFLDVGGPAGDEMSYASVGW